jgi:hypothetical protein
MRETNIGRLHSSGKLAGRHNRAVGRSIGGQKYALQDLGKPLWLLTNTRHATAWFRKLVTTIRKAEYIAGIR